MSETTHTLQSLRRDMSPPKPKELFDIDVSVFFPNTAEEDGPVLFWFRRFSINDMFAVSERAEIIKRQRPDWSERMCSEVAALILCHKEPAEEDLLVRTLFYCDLFSNEERDPELLLLLTEFGVKAGANFLRKAEEMVVGRKKNSKSPTRSRRRNTPRSHTVSPTSTDTPQK